MKNFFKKLTVIIAGLLVSMALIGQINLEQESSYAADEMFGSQVEAFPLEAVGTKYLKWDLFYWGDNYSSPDEVELYNLNHSLEIAIDINSVFEDTELSYDAYSGDEFGAGLPILSQNLFAISDTTIQIIQARSYTVGTDEMKRYGIFNINLEDGNIVDSYYLPETFYTPELIDTFEGPKLKLQTLDGNVIFYSIPGEFPCNPCIQYNYLGVNIEEIENFDNPGGLGLAFPNPATDYVNIPYEFPQGVSTGFIDIFNSMGQLVDSQQVTTVFSSYLLDVNAYESGTYLLVLRTNNQRINTARVVIQ